MNNLATIGIFILMVIAQWFVPVNMIVKEENVLKNGIVYKFKTQPIDPSDPFRGKYIILNYEMDSFKSDSTSYEFGEDLFVSISNDSLGFAKATGLSKDPPEKGDYVIANYTGRYNGQVNFTLPFDTFYMNEDKAMDAELAVREVQRDSLPTTCYALVYIMADRAILQDVQIDGVSIKDYVENP